MKYLAPACLVLLAPLTASCGAPVVDTEAEHYGSNEAPAPAVGGTLPAAVEDERAELHELPPPPSASDRDVG